MSQEIVIKGVQELTEDHNKQYQSYTKLMLSLSTGLIGVLSAFRSNWVADTDSYIWLTAVTMVSLIACFLAGMVVQHLMMVHGPKDVDDYLDAVSAKLRGQSESPLYYRNPNRSERFAFNLQIISFYLAAFSLSSYFLLNLKWG